MRNFLEREDTNHQSSLHCKGTSFSWKKEKRKTEKRLFGVLKNQFSEFFEIMTVKKPLFLRLLFFFFFEFCFCFGVCVGLGFFFVCFGFFGFCFSFRVLLLLLN